MKEWLIVCVDLLCEWLPAVIWHIAPALATAVLTGVVLQLFFVSTSTQAAFIDGLIKLMDQIQQDTLDYWNIDPSDATESERASILEQKIKGLLRALSSDLSFFAVRYGKSPLFDKLLVHLHDSCSGGDFESKDRKTDTNRYLVVVNAVNNLKSALMRRKL